MANKYNDPRWQRRRLEVMQRDDFKCCSCERSTETLNVHHKRYQGELWESPTEDLQTLCEPCHAALGPHPRGGIWWQVVKATGERIVMLAHCPKCARKSFTSRVGVCRCSSCGWDSSHHSHRVVCGSGVNVVHKAPLFWGKEVESFYLAGKITGTEWRESIVNGWSCANHTQCSEAVCNSGNAWETVEDAVVVAGGYPLSYVGPWWADCQGGHGYSSDTSRPHACGREWTHDGDIKRHVAKNIISAIDSASMVFAWIDSFDCYGTIWELGLAAGKGIPTVVGVKSGMKSALDELWLSLITANVWIESDCALNAWNSFWHDVSRGCHAKQWDRYRGAVMSAEELQRVSSELERLVASRRASMGIKQ